MKTGILLFAHGSPVEEANRGVHDLAAKIEAAGPYRYVRAAFLDSTQPDLNAGVRQAAGEIVDQLGQHERFILTEATAEEMEQGTDTGRVARPVTVTGVRNRSDMFNR